MDRTLKSCKLIKVIQVVTKEGTGTKENPIRESIVYFTTDGVRIGTLVNGVHHYQKQEGNKLAPETQILNSLLTGMNEYYASQQEGPQAEKK